eukprot:3509897-Rhodomonas_salina.1
MSTGRPPASCWLAKSRLRDSSMLMRKMTRRTGALRVRYATSCPGYSTHHVFSCSCSRSVVSPPQPRRRPCPMASAVVSQSASGGARVSRARTS